MLEFTFKLLLHHYYHNDHYPIYIKIHYILISQLG